VIDAPVILKAPAQHVASIHLTVPRAEIQQVMGPGISDVMVAIAAQGVAAAGPWLTHHLRMDPRIFDFEICVPVKSPIRASGRVQPGLLRATRVARTVYHGPYEGLGEAWGQFIAWIEKAGHRAAADLWEIYAEGPETSPDPSLWKTELNKPLDD
jgi:effector-binding domain-containing protein